MTASCCSMVSASLANADGSLRSPCTAGTSKRPALVWPRLNRVTSSPAAMRVSVMWRPTKEVPPMTSARMARNLGEGDLHAQPRADRGRVCGDRREGVLGGDAHALEERHLAGLARDQVGAAHQGGHVGADVRPGDGALVDREE